MNDLRLTPTGPSAIERARIHRLAARLANGTTLNYPHHRVDVRTLLDELERLREDNAHLREEKARIWAQVNAPKRSTRLRDIISGPALTLSLGLWGVVVTAAYAACRAGR